MEMETGLWEGDDCDDTLSCCTNFSPRAIRCLRTSLAIVVRLGGGPTGSCHLFYYFTMVSRASRFTASILITPHRTLLLFSSNIKLLPSRVQFLPHFTAQLDLPSSYNQKC